MNYHMSITHNKRPYDAKIVDNRSAIGSDLASGAYNRDSRVFQSEAYLDRNVSFPVYINPKKPH